MLQNHFDFKIGDIIKSPDCDSLLTVVGFRPEQKIVFFVPKEGTSYTNSTTWPIETINRYGKDIPSEYYIDILDFRLGDVYAHNGGAKFTMFEVIERLKTCFKCKRLNPCRASKHLCFDCLKK